MICLWENTDVSMKHLDTVSFLYVTTASTSIFILYSIINTWSWLLTPCRHFILLIAKFALEETRAQYLLCFPLPCIMFPVAITDWLVIVMCWYRIRCHMLRVYHSWWLFESVRYTLIKIEGMTVKYLFQICINWHRWYCRNLRYY